MDNNASVNLTESTLYLEACETVKEIASLVHYIGVSDVLSNSSDSVYLNVQILEGKSMCVELSKQGFLVVGKSYDTKDSAVDQSFFETIYSLLDYHSPLYRASFGNSLMKELQKLQESSDNQESL